MKNRAYLFLVILALGITTYSFTHSVGNLDGTARSSPFFSIDTSSDPKFSFLKQSVKEGIIYKGLPRQWDKEEFAEESKKAHFQKKADYFYEESKKIDPAFIKHIKEILRTKNTVRGYRESESGLRTVKFCGGFHADYMITLKTETQKVDLQICYGCGDMRLFLDDVFIEEYDMNTEYAFKKWTAPYSDLGSSTE